MIESGAPISLQRSTSGARCGGLRGADVILIPEVPFDLDEVCDTIRKRHARFCRDMNYNSSRVVTADKLASLVAEAWPHSFTSVNIMSGLKKTRCVPTESRRSEWSSAGTVKGPLFTTTVMQYHFRFTTWQSSFLIRASCIVREALRKEVRLAWWPDYVA